MSARGSKPQYRGKRGSPPIAEYAYVLILNSEGLPKPLLCSCSVFQTGLGL
jgi:hypothetical protein